MSTEPRTGAAGTGIRCPRYGHPALRRVDGCDYCERCDFDGVCG